MKLPALVIGLGSTGRATVEYLQTMMYAKYKGNLDSLDSFLKLLVFDTQNAGEVKWLPAPQSKIVYAPVVTEQSATGIYQALGEPEWCTPEAIAPYEAVKTGAMQNRALGRLILFSQFRNVIINGIDTALSELQNVQMNVGRFNQDFTRLNIRQSGFDTQHIYVFIVGSLTGGTCSSTFIDVARYLHTKTAKRPWGLFYVPPTVKQDWQELNDYKAAKECAWAALGDLRYQDIYGLADLESPDIGGGWRDDHPHFEKVALMAPKSDAIDLNRDTMEKVGAFFVYLNIWEGIQGIKGSAIPSIFSFGISGYYAPSFETAACATMDRITRCIEEITKEDRNHGDRPIRKARDYKTALLRLIRETLTSGVDMLLPQDRAKIGESVSRIQKGLSKNMFGAMDQAYASITSEVVKMLTGESNQTNHWDLEFVQTFLGSLKEQLKTMINSYPAVRPGEDTSRVLLLEPSFGLFARQIREDRWENFVESILLYQCKEVLDQVTNHIDKIMGYLRAVSVELTGDSKKQIAEWRKILKEELNPAGVTAVYRQGNVESDASTFDVVTGRFIGNPFKNGLFLDEESYQKILSSPNSDSIPKLVKTEIIDKAVKKVLPDFLGHLETLPLQQNIVPPTSCYLEFKQNFLRNNVAIAIPDVFKSDSQSGFNYSVKLTFYNLESKSTRSSLSSKIDLPNGFSPDKIQTSTLEMRKCMLSWRKVLEDIAELVSFLVCDYADIEGRYVRTGIRAGFTNFRFETPGTIRVRQDQAWRDITHLEDTAFAFLGSTLKHEIDSNGVQVPLVLDMLFNRLVFAEGHRDEEEQAAYKNKLNNTWELVKGGVYLW